MVFIRGSALLSVGIRHTLAPRFGNQQSNSACFEASAMAIVQAGFSLPLTELFTKPKKKSD